VSARVELRVNANHEYTGSVQARYTGGVLINGPLITQILLVMPSVISIIIGGCTKTRSCFGTASLI
jgi:hypothetical protein